MFTYMEKHTELDIINKVAASLFDLVAKDPRTIDEIAEAAGMSSGYLKQLKKGDRRLNIYYLYKIAMGLGKPPSEVLPKDWQKATTSSIDEEKMALILELIDTNPELRSESYAKKAKAANIIYTYSNLHPEFTKEKLADMLNFGMQFNQVNDLHS